MPLKIAMIGAGSIGFTRRLMTDLLTVPEFADTTTHLTHRVQNVPGKKVRASSRRAYPQPPP